MNDDKMTSKKKFSAALFMSSDRGVFDTEGDVARRMEEYTKLYESVHILVVARDLPTHTVEIYPHVFAHPVSYTRKAAGLWKLFMVGSKVVRENKPSGLYAQDPFWFGFVAFFLSYRYHIPFAVGVYGLDIHGRYFAREAFIQRIALLLTPFVFARADAIQADGPEMVEYLKGKYGAKVFFKPMFPANRKELGRIVHPKPTIPFKLLFVGRFAMQKNLPLLLDVVTGLIKGKGLNLTLTMVGGGKLKEEFFRQVKARGLEENVHDAGVFNRRQILDAYALHHILILTSHDEGFPRVFMEAALAGMPIVTSRVGGVKDLVIDGVTGKVFPQDTEVSVWTNELSALIASPSKIEEMSRAIREQFERVYGSKELLDYQRPIAEFLAVQD